MPFSRAQDSTFGTRASTLVAPLRDAARHALAEKPSLPVTESDSAPSAVPDGTASDGKRASAESRDEYVPNDEPTVQFRLYRRRFFGVAGLVRPIQSPAFARAHITRAFGAVRAQRRDRHVLSVVRAYS
jgi:hypothetical protein